MPQLRRNGPTANAALQLLAGFGMMAALQLMIAGQSSIRPTMFEADVNKARCYVLAMASIAAFRFDSKAGALGILMAAVSLEALGTIMPENPEARLAAASLIYRSGLVFGALLMPAAAMVDIAMAPTP